MTAHPSRWVFRRPFRARTLLPRPYPGPPPLPRGCPGLMSFRPSGANLLKSQRPRNPSRRNGPRPITTARVSGCARSGSRRGVLPDGPRARRAPPSGWIRTSCTSCCGTGILRRRGRLPCGVGWRWPAGAEAASTFSQKTLALSLSPKWHFSEFGSRVGGLRRPGGRVIHRTGAKMSLTA
jgi:hypothetical protein